MNKELIITIMATFFSSSVLSTLFTLWMSRKKTEVDIKKVDSETHNTVLNVQNDLLEKLLERSQRLVDENEKLQKEYGDMLVENAKLRSDIVGYLKTISALQKDTTNMRAEIQVIMERVREIDKHLESISVMTEAGNSNPFPKEEKVVK